MKVSELSCALLDYWTARAEGVPADDLKIRLIIRQGGPYGPYSICVRPGCPVANRDMRIDYSTNWAMTGPLRDKLSISIERSNYEDEGKVFAYIDDASAGQFGPTALIAICRAVVRAAFGDEVPEVAPS